MKKMNLLLGAAMLGSLALLCLVNLILPKMQLSGEENGYRVSLNRLEWAIREFEQEEGRAAGSLEELEGFQSEADSLEELERFQGAAGYPFVEKVAVLEYGAGYSPSDAWGKNPPVFGGNWKEFWGNNEGGEYAVIASDYAFYKIFYSAGEGARQPAILLVNAAVISAILLLWIVLWYVRQKILLPFSQLMDLPYELSKGNLSLPLKESKSRFFGKFLWGMDMLRENLEENKSRELELQKEKKLLLLSLSHDIKTPLSAICLYAQALGKNLYREESKKQEIAGKIKEKAEEIEAYIGEIVTASHEDFLNFQVENSEVYVGDALGQIRRYYQDKMALNQVAFSMGKYPNCLVWGDLDRIVEVVQNVVENAIKYGDGRMIQIRAGREEEPDSFLIVVRNTGCGLAQKELPHVFDSFLGAAMWGKTRAAGWGFISAGSLCTRWKGKLRQASGKKRGNCGWRSGLPCVWLKAGRNKQRILLGQRCRLL